MKPIAWSFCALQNFTRMNHFSCDRWGRAYLKKWRNLFLAMQWRPTPFFFWPCCIESAFRDSHHAHLSSQRRCILHSNLTLSLLLISLLSFSPLFLSFVPGWSLEHDTDKSMRSSVEMNDGPLWRDTILVRITIAKMRHHDQSKVGRKRFIPLPLPLPHHGLSSKEVRAGT